MYILNVAVLFFVQSWSTDIHVFSVKCLVSKHSRLLQRRQLSVSQTYMLYCDVDM